MRQGGITLTLAAFAASCTMPPVSGACQLPALSGEHVSKTVTARQAFFFALPLYEMSRMRQRMLSLPGAAPNVLLHRSTLSRPSDRTITTPNIDTLYSTAWLDLAEGPVRLSIPAMDNRYHSVQLMDALSDTFAVLRNRGDGARTFLIVGPEWAGHAGPAETIVDSPTRDVWLVARTFVKGSHDLAWAQTLQAAYEIETKASDPIARDESIEIPERPDGREFLTVVNASLARGPLARIHDNRIARFEEVGVLPDANNEERAIDSSLGRLWDQNIAQFYDEARRAFESAGIERNGWHYPSPHIGKFGTDDIYRSAMALGGLAALPAKEAINPIATRDSDGTTLNGSSNYRLRIPGSIPVDGFWSLTLYESDGAGRWYLYDNAIDRYAVSNGADHLKRRTGGEIVLNISHKAPADVTNWLPAPDDDFMLVFRAYQPQPAFVDGLFVLQAVERIEH